MIINYEIIQACNSLIKKNRAFYNKLTKMYKCVFQLNLLDFYPLDFGIFVGRCLFLVLFCFLNYYFDI